MLLYDLCIRSIAGRDQMRRRIVKGCLFSLAIVLALVIAAACLAIYQGHRTPSGKPEYVALGSSYAAGAGLGALQANSPLLCARSVAGYPQRLALRLKLPIVDMTCGGAVTSHLLSGGQFFQGPQIRMVDARTRLVTITAGGNDIGLVGDLSMLAMRNSGGIGGWLASKAWGGPQQTRDFAKLGRELFAVIRTVRARAPNATIVLATYPAILPPEGTCPPLRLSAAEADLMRRVEQALAATTRAAAMRGGAILVDMHALGAAHNACSAQPWTHGWAKLSEAPFHPTEAGAAATAGAIAAALQHSPAGIAAVR
jgi:lysophospholipase L1-like esterase